QAVVATPVAGPAPWWAADPFPSSHATARAPRGPRTAGERARIWVLVGLGLLLNLAALGFAAAWWSGALDPKPAVSTEQTPATAAPTPAGKRAERGTYRYVRYVAPAESWGNIAEFEVYGGPAGGRLKGTVIGTTGSWEDSGNTREKAFDGDLESFFDAPDTIAEGAWVGLDLGSAQVLTRVRFAPRPGYGGRMVGGVFQASNAADFSSGVVDLFAVTDAPPEGAFSARAVGTPPPRGRKARPDPDTDLDGVRD
ncbi:MAG: discoidin domain-containing protein, partial [Gemmataceae bacterium]|nr:discoidin domain-containing protein [Gemmataceae bacterium]